MVNKYSQLGTMYLIRAIQKLGQQYEHNSLASKADKDKFLGDMSEMKTALNAEMENFDRSRPDFFPLDVLVVFHRVDMGTAWDDFDTTALPQKEKTGVVVARDEKKVIVKFEGEDHLEKVDPNDLKIKYI